MTEFFKMRFELMRKNNLGNYVKYALAEIVLVMVGILLAVQVNNWNENRKAEFKEIKTLQELRSDLIQNRNDIEINISSWRACLSSNEIIIHHMDNHIPYHDSLNFHFSNLYPYITFNVNQTTYENLKQTGLNLISNDSLRLAISDLYANQFASYRNFENIYLVEHHHNDIKPIVISEFTSFSYQTSAVPRDYDRLMNNPRNREIMFWTTEICKVFIQIQSGLRENVEELMIRIEKEIGE